MAGNVDGTGKLDALGETRREEDDSCQPPVFSGREKRVPGMLLIDSWRWAEARTTIFILLGSVGPVSPPQLVRGGHQDRWRQRKKVMVGANKATKFIWTPRNEDQGPPCHVNIKQNKTGFFPVAILVCM